MRLTTIARAAGLTLARDLPPLTADGPPLLRAGTVITPRYQRSLAEAGVREVWVGDALGERVAARERLPEAVRRRAAERVAGALNDTAQALGGQQVLSEATLHELRSVVELIAASIAESSDVTMAVNDLAAADAHVHRHSLNVCALGLLLGHGLFERRGWVDHVGRTRRDRLRPRLAQLGLGLLLHDIGKLSIPAELLQKQGLDSHSARPYRAAAPAHDGVRVIRNGSGKAFDPEVVDVFLRVVMPYPVGATLELEEGVEGVVVSVDPSDPERPWVRVPGPGGSREVMVDCTQALVHAA